MKTASGEIALAVLEEAIEEVDLALTWLDKTPDLPPAAVDWTRAARQCLLDVAYLTARRGTKVGRESAHSRGPMNPYLGEIRWFKN